MRLAKYRSYMDSNVIQVFLHPPKLSLTRGMMKLVVSSSAWRLIIAFCNTYRFIDISVEEAVS